MITLRGRRIIRKHEFRGRRWIRRKSDTECLLEFFGGCECEYKEVYSIQVWSITFGGHRNKWDERQVTQNSSWRHRKH